MRNTLAATALTALLAVPAFAAGADLIDMNTVLGTSLKDVKAALTAQGFDARKGEMEDGLIEVNAVKDGHMAEVYVDPQTGLPTRVKVK